jgi:signal transduction histidine kinase
VWEPLSHDTKPEVMGVLQVLNKKDGIFDIEDERLLELLATQVAISIANSRLYHQLEKKYNEIDTLYEFEKYLSSMFNLPELLQKILAITIDYLKAKRLFIYFPLEGLHICASVDDKYQKQYESVTEVASGWLRFVRKPDITKLTNAWQNIENCFEIKVNPARFKENILYSKIQLHNAKDGIVIAMGVSADNGNDFQDEKKLIELVSQKISRAVELESLRKDLLKKESLSVIGQMMSNIIHDINSPITAIDGFVDLLQEDSLTIEERREFASIIRQEIKALMGMSREILDFAKGKTQILPRKSSAKKLIKRLEPTLKQMCEMSTTELNIKSESTQVIYVDEEKINRVFYNLSKNAIEAMGENGKLWINIYDDKDMVVFQFRDNGPGIPKEIRNQIFDSFVTSGKDSGTGLGLAIVKKIVEEHKGFVDIESMEGKGAIFRVNLPVYNKKRVHS